MTYQDLEKHILKRQAINVALTLLSWDQETEAPSESIDHTSKMIGVLSSEYVNIILHPEVKTILLDLKQQELPVKQKAVVKEWLKEIEKLEKIPIEEYQSHQELLMKAQHQWQIAKKENDYELFKPYLKQVIENEKRFATYRHTHQDNLYDVLLDDYEPGFTTVKLDEFFTLLKKEIVPLVQQIKTSPKSMDKTFMNRSFSIEKQKEFNHYLAKYLGFDFNRGLIKESEHPFTTNFHNHDVRFTTHYYENNLESAIFSTIHETGHALYELGIADDITLTPVGTGVSMGMHESQSRFFENVIGRSEMFWENLFDKLKTVFEKELEDVNFECFMEAINKVENSLVRIEADELTYSMHIMIRYEIEKKMFNEEIDFDTLPQLWNTLYQEYLGVTPKNNSEGIMQDVHWAGGLLGYFPSYAIGSAIASQIDAYMKTHTDMEQWIRGGDFDSIKKYLAKSIHQHGAIYNTNELLLKMTGEEFDAKYYVDYLKMKFSHIYQLK